MDGGNRRFHLVSTFMALPALAMATTLATAAPPAEIALAVGDGEEVAVVQQVVGKQPHRNPSSKTGILSALVGDKSNQSSGKSGSSHPMKPQGRGLLDGLFGKKSPNTRSTSPHQHTAKTHSSSSKTNSNPSQQNGKAAVDWEGIPFHHATAARQSTGKTPISDPSSYESSGPSSLADGGTRIIRGGSARTIDARPASTRREPTLAPPPVRAIAVSKAPSVSRPTPLPSSTSSSRRSGRRNLDALEADELAAAGRAPSSIAASDSDALVPKVSRRAIKKPADATVAQQAPKVERKPIASPKAESVAKADPVTDAPAAIEDGPVTEKAAPAPTASAVASSRRAIPSTHSTPQATLAAPLPEPAKDYTTPIATAPKTADQEAATPSLATAPKSTPSLSVAHRSGPPASAFTPTKVADEAAPYSAASSPVGSGVATGAASYRRPSPGQTYPSTDPYQASEAQAQVAARPRHDTAVVPMHPIESKPAAAAHGAVPAGQPAASGFAPRQPQGMRQPAANGEPATPAGTTAATSELPGIRVITNGPAEVMIRQTNQYEIRIENRGTIDAHNLLVGAIVPDWAELRGQNATRGSIETKGQGSRDRLVWSIDQLPAGATERMLVRLKAAKSGTYQLDVDWTMAPQKSVAKVHVHEPKLGLSIDGPDQVVYGQSQTYKVRVLNPGDGTAPNVVFTLSPNSATPQTQRIGDIPPGKEAQFEVELTAQDLGDLKIHGLAAGDLELRAEASKTIRVAAARLEAVLTGPELKYQNTESMYNLQVQNNGVATSEKIAASITLPAGVKYLGGIDEAQLRGSQLRWEIAALPPGAIQNYQFRCDMAATGEQVFAFDCRGTAAGNADVSIATQVESIADLVLTISDPAAPAPIGADVSYEIVVRNRGSKEATDVHAVAQFGHGIEPLRVEGQSGEVVTGQVLFDAIPRIGPGEEVRLRVVAQAERAGHHRFRAEVRSGDTVLVAEEATHYMSPTSERVSRRSTDGTTKR